MSDDLVAVLTRFHREVALPEMKEFVHATVGELRSRLALLEQQVRTLEERLSA